MPPGRLGAGAAAGALGRLGAEDELDLLDEDDEDDRDPLELELRPKLEASALGKAAMMVLEISTADKSFVNFILTPS
jgi:hypothetical protein